MKNNGMPWDLKSRHFIAKNWERMTDVQMGMELGRSENAVRDRRKMMTHRRRGSGRPSKQGQWSEGRAIQSAADFVNKIGHLTTNEKLWHIDRRMIEVNACLMFLFQNCPKNKRWGDVDARTFQQLQSIVKDLKTVRECVRCMDAFQADA